MKGEFWPDGTKMIRAGLQTLGKRAPNSTGTKTVTFQDLRSDRGVQNSAL